MAWISRKGQTARMLMWPGSPEVPRQSVDRRLVGSMAAMLFSHCNIKFFLLVINKHQGKPE